MTLMHQTTQLLSRDEIPSLVRDNGLGIELGVYYGNYSNCILQNSNLRTLISLDCWAFGKFSSTPHFTKTCKQLKKYGDRSIIFKARFEDVVDWFPDETFDFIYIDGLHSYKMVSRDIAQWWPKLRNGGLFSGHDYFPFKTKIKGKKNYSKSYHSDNSGWSKSKSVYKWGVIEAVDEHVSKYSLDLQLTGVKNRIDQGLKSWYCWK